VNHNAVVDDFDEFGVGDLFAAVVKTRRPKNYVERLPLAGFSRGVDPRRLAFEPFPVGPALVNAPAVGERWFFYTPTVQNLEFVPALKIDAGVRAFGNYELEVCVYVAMLEFGDEVLGVADLTPEFSPGRE
jgi:hypothetical protein